MTKPNHSPRVDVRSRARRKIKGTRTVGNFSLRTKVIVAFLIVTLSAVGTVVFFSDITNRISLTENVGANLKTLARGKASTIEALLGKQIDVLEVLALSDTVQESVSRANAAYAQPSDLPAIRNAIAQRDVAWTIAPENDPLVQSVLTNVAASELQEFRTRFPDNAEILVTDKYGATIAATNRTAKYDQAEQSWWQGAYNSNQGAIYISQPDFNRSLATFGVIIAIPIRSPDSQSIEGVLHALYRIDAITDALGAERFGQTGRAGLLLGGGQMLTPEGIIVVPPEELEQLMASMTADYAAFNYGGAPQLVSQAPVVPAAAGRSAIVDLDWRLVVAQTPDEALEPIFTTERTTVIVGLVTLALTVVLAVGVAQLLSRPIMRLTAVAERIGAGDLKAQAAVESSDEIGKLAATFNAMTTQLRTLVESLEDRVAARTEQLRTSADVGRTAVSTLDPDQLLHAVVNLITDRFGFYYAAVFTLDATGKYAVLQDATGEAGRILKERHHQLEVGGQSMVGYVTAQRKARIALDVGEEAVRFANPLLPDTRSEIALPLVVGDRVLGALDAQSTQEAAFDEANASVLQVMADQIAIALENARLFEQTQRALRKAEYLSKFTSAIANSTHIQGACQYMATYFNDIVQADRTYLFLIDSKKKQVVAKAGHGNIPDLEEQTYDLLNAGITGMVIQSGKPVLSLSADDGIEPAETRERRKQAGTGALIVAPLQNKGEVIGTITTVNRDDQRLFNQDDVDLLMAMAAQTETIIENLRLLEQTQRTLSELDEINRRLTGEGWEAFARRRSSGGSMWVSTMEQSPSSGGADRAQHEPLPEVTEALNRGEIALHPIGRGDLLGVAVPIKLRDVAIGALRLAIPQSAWNADMSALLDSIAGHVAQAVENARLIAVTEQRLTRERALAEATEKVRQRSEIETILQTATTELARYLNASHIAVHLSPEVQPGDGDSQHAGR